MGLGGSLVQGEGSIICWLCLHISSTEFPLTVPSDQQHKKKNVSAVDFQLQHSHLGDHPVLHLWSASTFYSRVG